MTKREVFEKVKTHLLQQNERSQDGKGNCTYRGKDGLMCAAGCLIENMYYCLELEGTAVSRDAPVDEALIASGVPKSALSMVRELQVMHDEEPIEFWERALRRIERKHFGSEEA